jgi:ankyrin repeat protein
MGRSARSARKVKVWWEAAVKRGDVGELRRLLEGGADIEARGGGGWTALLSAVEYGHINVMECLLDRGADIEVQNFLGWAALTTAASMGRRDLVECLLDHGADIEARVGEAGDGGDTALITAAMDGHREVVECLLDRGANIEAPRNGRNGEGLTVLMLVAANGKGGKEMVEYLLDRGADIEAQTRVGWRALTAAAHHGERGVVECLIDRGANYEEAISSASSLKLNLRLNDKSELLNDLISASRHLRKVRRNPAVCHIFESLGCDGLIGEEGGTGGASATNMSIASLAQAMFRGKLDSEANFRLLFETEKAASVVHRLARCCSHCQRSEIRSGTKVLACKGCRVVHYCSPACQRLAWPQHKASCLQAAARKSAAGDEK